MIVELDTSGEDENSLGIVIGGNTDWILGTNTSLTSDVIRLNQLISGKKKKKKTRRGQVVRSLSMAIKNDGFI